MDSEHLTNIKGVLFDLDGTLLQVEMREFIPAYIDGLARHFSDVALRYTFGRTIRDAIAALLTSDHGSATNEELFVGVLKYRFGIDANLFGERLARYCADGLADLQPLIRPLPIARQILLRCFERGLKVVVATNPVFPRSVVDARLRWGGIDDFPFDLVTSFENSRYCKPHSGYFLDVLGELGLAPEECLMVGNDTEHDLGARAAGIPTFLVDTWMVDRSAGNFVTDFRGGHLDLFQFLGRVGGEGEQAIG